MSSSVIWKLRPLTTIEIGCLSVLTINNTCAYDAAYAINAEAKNKFSISPSAVALALKRMEALSMVKSDHTKLVSRRAGRKYTITTFGEAQLAMEIERLADVVAVGRFRLELRREARERFEGRERREGEPGADGSQFGPEVFVASVEMLDID